MSEINVAQRLLSEGCETVSGMGHLLGYARVSTLDQDPALQLDALAASGMPPGVLRRPRLRSQQGRSSRPSRQALDQLRPGDTLVVWKLDRLGRSLRHLIETVTALAERGIGFRSLQEAIDTTTSGGKLVFHVFGALAEFERDLIRERTRRGWPRPGPGDARAAGRRS